MQIEDKITILADAAKYDVSCASSGSGRKNAPGGLGHAAPSGICHTYTEDGRCVSLLKLLYSNMCIYDCAYCVNRAGNDIRRAAFTAREVVDLTIDFYRRNYIEGLFLSSGVFGSPDHTMERLVRVASMLREQGYNGYIHLKCVPYASADLVRLAGLHADRLSVNIELPTEKSLQSLARDKTYASVLQPMGVIRETIAESIENRRRMRHAPAFAPAGQSTQLIIGASPESDFEILQLADGLYRRQALKRVYYSAFIPPPRRDARLPDTTEPPLVRENRLYQADWLVRLYGFELDEIVDADHPDLDLNIDPKQVFARRHPQLFPVDINAAGREMVLRVPGIGLQSANRIIHLRRLGRIRFEHLQQMGVAVGRALPFIRCDGMPTNRFQRKFDDQRRAVRVAERPGRVANPLVGGRRLVFVTDGSFEGLLSAVFEAFAGPRPPDAVESGDIVQSTLFDRRVRIATDAVKSERVWKGLKKHLGADRRRQVYQAFLSGADRVQTSILRYLIDAVPGRRRPGGEAHLADHIRVEKLSRKVRREAHRMKGFIRFQSVGDDHFMAVIEPRYDVLPLVRRHFEQRFADQQWVIYDTCRDYGLYFNRGRTREIRQAVDAGRTARAQDPTSDEVFCQSLWQRYYAAADIAERRNIRLQLRQLPRRFWRYLPEKSKSV